MPVRSAFYTLGRGPHTGSVAHRIAHILAWPTVAGTEIATRRIVQCLQGPEYRHVVFCRREAETVQSFFRAAAFETVVYDTVDLSYRHPGAFLRTSWRLARQLRQLGIDLVHCSDLLAGLHAAPAARLARLPVICHIRNPHPHIARHDKPVLWAVDRFIFVSRDAWSAFDYAVPASRGSVVYDGIETTPVDRHAARRQLLESFAFPPDARLVGMIGRLAPQKDYTTFLKAAGRVVGDYPSARFLVIGDHTGNEAFRSYHEELLHLIRALGLGDHVVFTGFRDDVPKVLSGLDVFVLCSHFEGLPLVILEAMAQQTRSSRPRSAVFRRSSLMGRRDCCTGTRMPSISRRRSSASCRPRRSASIWRWPGSVWSRSGSPFDALPPTWTRSIGACWARAVSGRPPGERRKPS